MDQLTPGRQTHIAGLDLLRILSMVMIIGLHMLGQGGIVDAAPPGSPTWYASQGLQCLFYCSVNCYGLLSGYVGGKRSGSGSRLLLLWLTVEVYSVLFWVFFRWRSPELVGRQAFINAVFPLLMRQYWYFTGYFGLALIIPLISEGLERLDERSAARRFFILLLFFCLLPTAFHSDAFHMRGGYTTLWLLLLYLMGAALRRGRWFQRLGVLPLVLTGVICLGITYVTILWPLTIPFVSTFDFLSYSSPTVTLLAACLVLLFARIRGKGGRGQAVLKELSRTSFGVYIIHTNPLLWWLSFPVGFLQHWASWPVWKLVLTVPAVAAAVYLVCAAVDYLRMLAFRALRLQQAAERLFSRFD